MEQQQGVPADQADDSVDQGRTVSTVSEIVPLKNSPVVLGANSVHFTDEPGMQVALTASCKFFSTQTYMTTAEARALAAALIKCADHFDRVSA